jgi:hypothetical protein
MITSPHDDAAGVSAGRKHLVQSLGSPGYARAQSARLRRPVTQVSETQREWLLQPGASREALRRGSPEQAVNRPGVRWRLGKP